MKNRMRVGTMRRSGLSLALAASLALLASGPLVAKVDAAPRGPADTQLAPQSVASLKAGEAQLAGGQRQSAVDSFEAALAADPRNIRAYIGLARAAEADGLPGKAVRFYREALQIDPNDLTALELQGNALVVRGATARAEANLERLKTLCAAPCAPADRLAASIAKGPPAAKTAAKAADGKTASLEAVKP